MNVTNGLNGPPLQRPPFPVRKWGDEPASPQRRKNYFFFRFFGAGFFLVRLVRASHLR